MKLSNNFRLDEFTRSETAARLQIKNEPSAADIENIRRLTEKLLQPLRDSYGLPFYINSGYRSPALNKAVGGVSSSQHTQGKAADIRVKDPRKLLEELKNTGLEFDQAILYPSFLHLSYNEGKNRRQILAAKGVKI